MLYGSCMPRPLLMPSTRLLSILRTIYWLRMKCTISTTDTFLRIIANAYTHRVITLTQLFVPQLYCTLFRGHRLRRFSFIAPEENSLFKSFFHFLFVGNMLPDWPTSCRLYSLSLLFTLHFLCARCEFFIRPSIGCWKDVVWYLFLISKKWSGARQKSNRIKWINLRSHEGSCHLPYHRHPWREMKYAEFKEWQIAI